MQETVYLITVLQDKVSLWYEHFHAGNLTSNCEAFKESSSWIIELLEDSLALIIHISSLECYRLAVIKGRKSSLH